MNSVLRNKCPRLIVSCIQCALLEKGSKTFEPSSWCGTRKISTVPNKQKKNASPCYIQWRWAEWMRRVRNSTRPCVALQRCQGRPDGRPTQCQHTMLPLRKLRSLYRSNKSKQAHRVSDSHETLVDNPGQYVQSASQVVGESIPAEKIEEIGWPSPRVSSPFTMLTDAALLHKK
jgi:hypothetical protein